MALADAALVISDLLQRPNNALNAAHPAAGLPRLQSAVFGSAVMGYGDLFIAGVLGGLLAVTVGRSLQLRAAALTALLAIGFDLLFFFVDELPATVPVALALVLVMLRRPLRSSPRSGDPDGARPVASAERSLAGGLRSCGDRPRGDLDGVGRQHLAFGCRAGLLDPSHLGHHAMVEGADRLVVRGHGRVELAADLRQRFHEATEAAVQLARRLGDVARRACDQLLAPAVVDGPQQPDQRGRRRHQNLLLDAVLDQRRVLRESGLVDAVGGNEHHDELGRGIELALVALGGEFGDVLARLPRVAGAVQLALVLIRCLDRRQVRVERDLRVDHHQLPAGEAHEHVGAQRSLARLDRALLDEVAVRDHPGHLDDVAKLDLPPRAAGGGPLQRGHEVAGLLAQRADALAELTHHLRELALTLSALALQAPDLALHPAELLRHGVDDALDLLRARGHLARGALLLGAARLLKPLGERVAGLAQHVQRDRLQLLAQSLLAARVAHVASTLPQRRRTGGAEQHPDDQKQEGHSDPSG